MQIVSFLVEQQLLHFLNEGRQLSAPGIISCQFIQLGFAMRLLCLGCSIMTKTPQIL